MASLVGLGLAGGGLSAVAETDALSASLIAVEARLGARLGACIVDAESGRTWSHRADERFPLTSTFKILAGAAVLAGIDAGRIDPDRPVVFGPSDLVTYSPVTATRVGGAGMSLSELCAAAITVSDNTAANLLLRAIGGPEGLTRFLRAIGDDVTRLDRWEPDLSEAARGDPRDTTTPAAMVATLGRLLLGPVLSERSRRQLTEWMIADAVAGALLRAGLPKTWRIADKTGAGRDGARAIAAVVWPPGYGPVRVSIHLSETTATMAERDAAIAEIGAVLTAVLGG